MFIHDYLVKAIQDDARRASERDRLLREARRARRARHQRLVPPGSSEAPNRMGKIVVSENVTLDGVIQVPAGDEGLRAGGWAGLTGSSPQLAKLALECLRALPPDRHPGERLSSTWHEGDHRNQDAATTFHRPGTEDRPRW